ncbi:MAG: AMP-binding protein, partial [Candidatus Omnitrophota bacterium]
MAYRQISDEMILASGLYEKEENYWFNQLSGRLERTHFPTDYSIYKQETLSSKRDDRRMETVDFQLNGELFSRLMWLSNESHPRLHMILVAGILALLVKYSYNGEMDAMVGAPVYDQGIEGDFINTMVILRNHLRGDMTFKELLVNVKQTILEAMENQNYPFEILLDRLNHSESSSDFVFIDIFILLENIHDIHYIQNARPNTLFVFSCQESEERITGRVEYNALVYNGKSVERLIGYFQNLLNITLADPDILLRDIDIISKEEKEQLIDAFNDTDCSWPNNKTIHELFEEQVIKGGDRIAVTGAFRETPLQITYRQLNDQSNRIASILRDKGVQSNSIVALMLERSVEMIPAMLGVLKAGGAYLPLDPDHPQSRISGTLEDSRAKVLLTQQNVLKTHSFTALKGLQHTRIKPCVTSPCPPIASMDDLPFPDRSLVSVERYNHYIGQAMVKHSMALQGTRGCPYHCAYCHKIWPKKHVARSAENLYSEVKLYYDMGVRRFVLIDDIFNLDIKNSTEFFQKIINNHLDIKLFFPNGLRGDILTPEYIDLMVEAGTINVALALETASPRLQKLIKKNLNLDRLQDSLSYFEEKYPQVILELFTMHGFPTETEEEAMMTLDFIKRQKWLHFPYVHILKIYPNTEMADLAIAHGIRKEAIAASTTLAYHELPETLPFDKGFTLNYQADFFNNYFLNNERLRHVLPYQARTLTEDELVKKYDSYLPQKIDSFDSLLTFTGIGRDEINISNFLDENNVSVPDIDQKIRAHFPVHSFKPEALRILFLDLSKYFNHDEHMLYDVVEPPLGLIYVLTYLNRELGDRVNGKIAKSGIDFNTYDELKKLIEGFQPDVIGIRTLSLFKDFFHHTVSMIRQWGIDVPIIAGGPYATSDYSSVLQDAHIDVIVLGEGEIITSRLIETIIENGNRLPGEEILQTIPGIAFIPKSKKSKKEQGALSPEIIIIDDESFFSSSQSDHSMNPVAVSHPHRSAYVIYTSGSTGKPKGVVLEHRNVVRLLFNDQFQFEFSNRDIWTMFHSYCFDFSVWEMYGALLYGGKLMVVPLLIAKDTGRFLELIKRENVTVLNQTPSAFYNLIELELNERSLSLTIRYVIFGGEALHPARLKEWRTKYPDTILVNMYGITETTVHVTYKRIENHDIETGISNIGKPIPTLRVYIIDKNANFLPVGVSGELVVGGEGVGRGYLNRPELTFEMFSGSRLPVAGNNKNNLNPSQNKSFWSHLFSKRWAAGGIL